MKKDLTELVFILDRSGSMSGLEADTIGGFNSMIAKQKKEPGEAFVSTVLFDSYSEVIHDRLKLENVPVLTEKNIRFVAALLYLMPSVVLFITLQTSTNMPDPRMFLSTQCLLSQRTGWKMQAVTTALKRCVP